MQFASGMPDMGGMGGAPGAAGGAGGAGPTIEEVCPQFLALQ